VLILAGIAIAILAALGLYIAVGSPGFRDQPYRARLAQWTNGDPRQLKPPEMAAVLKGLAAQHPDDPEAWEYLARAYMAAGDPVASLEPLRRAIKLSPGQADLHAMLGEALAGSTDDGSMPPQAITEFRRALALEPTNLASQFFLARAQVQSGDVAGGVAVWRALQAQLPPGDPRRAMVENEIAKASGVPAGGEAIASASAPEQAVFIQGMVKRLAARLETTPDDPDGWARLVRAYKVLGDKDGQAKALARARVLFAKRPADLAKVEAEAAPAP
jgi:cytochrome c-type biogenesis protein CcmH